MGVDIYLLNRAKVTLLIDGLPNRIGTLRRLSKVTELGKERAAQLEALKATVPAKPGPCAVMAADFEIPLATAPERPVEAHLVLGWDAGRAYATDLHWDYLPTLGYAVRNPNSNDYTLHEMRAGLLHPLSVNQATVLGILNEKGKLIRRGQPSIIDCHFVRPYISTYAEAKCVLNDGNTIDLLTSIEPGNLPDPAWYIGKRPSDVNRYHMST